MCCEAGVYVGIGIKLVDLKTYIPELGVVVSTVAWSGEIGYRRSAETMVFKGNIEEIVDWNELYMESHGYCTDVCELCREHCRIVKEIKSGKIKLKMGDET